MTDTYRDGVGAFRCKACGHAIYDAAEGPLVSIRQDDLEALVYILGGLVEGLACPLTAALLERLAHADGQSLAQIRARVEGRI